MIENFNSWFWGSFFGPLNKRRFGLRIWLRVRWLTFKLWFKHIRWRRLGGFFVRPALLLLIAAGMPLLFLWYRAQLFPGVELPSKLSLGSQADWRAIAQPALILIGVPAAFVLWMFRDANAQADLENRRKDVNLKEFQEIQLRAAGAMDEKLPESARESLQIAATHQLAGFLRGEYGASFQRPAWELLRARLLASSQAMGYQSIPSQIEAWHKAEPADRVSARKLGKNIRDAVNAVNINSIGQAQRDAVRDEWHTIFSGRLPLQGTVFDKISLPRGAMLTARDLLRCSFIDAYLGGVHLESAYLGHVHLDGAYLADAHLEGAYLWDAHLEGVYLWDAHLEGAYLWDAHLEGAEMRGAHLEGADLADAHLQGADLKDAHLEGTNLRGAKFDESTDLTNAVFDDTTQFSYARDALSHDEKDAARAPWVARGMKHVDEFKKERDDRLADDVSAA